MEHTTILQDLFGHNDWANARIHSLCATLSDEQLDKYREMGFGSLRNTVFHILEAEKLWLERWQSKPWRPLEPDAKGMSITDIRAESQAVSEIRNAMMADDASSGYGRIVDFQDSLQNAYSIPVGDLMHHVANHGIHHRAQALSYLKGFGLTIPVGLDYIFWKMAQPSCPMPTESIAPIREFGLEIATQDGFAPKFELDRIQKYFAYNDWAMTQIFEQSAKLDDPQLDQDMQMGFGSLRKTLQHVIDAERYWQANWENDCSPFPGDDHSRSLSELKALFFETAEIRDEFVAQLDEDSADRIARVQAGGPETCYRVCESLLQLCAHGTHHRAQCVNMLKQHGVTFGWIDMIVWLREDK